MAVSLIEYLGKIIIDFSPVNSLANEEHAKAVEDIFDKLVCHVYEEIGEIEVIKIITREPVDSELFDNKVSGALYEHEMSCARFYDCKLEISHALYFSENYEVIVNYVCTNPLSMFVALDPVYVAIIKGYVEDFKVFS